MIPYSTEPLEETSSRFAPDNETQIEIVRTLFVSVMGYDVSGTEISERPVRFDGDNFLQFKHRYGRRYVIFPFLTSIEI